MRISDFVNLNNLPENVAEFSVKMPVELVQLFDIGYTEQMPDGKKSIEFTEKSQCARDFIHNPDLITMHFKIRHHVVISD